MKKTGLLFCLLLILMILGKSSAQTLVCNDLVQFSLDENCAHTIIPDEILEGINWVNCVVELDKTLPLGNGPWVSAVLGPPDVNQSYQVRVRHVPSGNICWGNIKVEDKLPPVMKCTEVSTVNLNGSSPVTVTTSDLVLTAIDACSGVTLNPASLAFDCADLGVNIIQLSASDASGNVATCQHTLLVSNSTNCLTCVANCPESVVVSYDEGHQVLLPAFQNSDWSAFDPFGNALFDAACVSTDSTYLVSYEPGIAGQNWFSRQWLWHDGTGQPVSCTQSIVFPQTHTVTVQGKVYIDSSQDCNPDAGEQTVDLWPLVVTKLPSGTTNTISVNPDGTYALEIVFGTQDLSAQVHLALPAGVNSVCPSAINIPNITTTPQYTFDIGLYTAGDCPVMQVSLGSSIVRRCFGANYTLQYCNLGLDTAYNAYVEVNLDPLIGLQAASQPYTVSGPDNIFTFQLGDVPPLYCGNIFMNVMVDCAAQIGQTLCSEATVYPNMPCTGPYTGVLVTTTAHCSGDTVSLSVWNQGQADMTAPLGYIVVEDFIMYKDDTFQLDAGDSITIKTMANGATWRIEAAQALTFPTQGLVTATIEGCGGLNTSGLINTFTQSDNPLYYDLDCAIIRASVDPNDKTAVPTGASAEHFIRANEPIEYMIRFQNTGNDTAFKVVIVDTLSSLLDPSTLESGASSHSYRLDIFPGGILHFVFQPIALPDSNINEAASHGFVKFRIAQQPNLPSGTVIENTAGIYFDSNAPVITNTAFHTVGYPFQVSNTWTANAPGLQVTLTPNPFQDHALLAVEGKRLSKGQVLLYNGQGRLLLTQDLRDNHTILSRGNLPAGVYFFQILDQGIGVAGGKIILD